MAQNTATPLVLNNGIYLQSTETDFTTHLDRAHVMYAMKGKQAPKTDLGIIQPFVSSGYLVKPYLYNFSGMGKNRIETDGHIFTWKTPLHEEPLYIVEDISGTDKPGYGGETFKIKTNKRKYGQGYVIGIDQHDPHHLLITPEEIIEDGDGVILTVRLKSIDQANRWFPKEYLRPGTKLFAITTYDSEYNETYSDLPSMSGGMREYFNTVGYSSAQVHFSITREAAFSKISEECVAGIDDYRKVIEMYMFKPGSHGYDLSLQGQQPHNLEASYKSKYGSGAKSQMKYDIAAKMWIPRIEALALSWLETMVEQEAIWGSGGLVSYDGKQKVQSSLGLFPQLNMGNKHTYNLFTWTLEKFEFVLASRLAGRSDNAGDIVIKTGKGGLSLVQNWLRNIPGESGMISHSKDYIQNVGSQNQIWTPGEFTGWRMRNGMGTIRFELAEGLDPHDANEQVNPVVPATKGIGGHRLSSYMFIIDDITNNDSGNICELVYGPDWDYRRSVIQGKMPYPGNTFGNGMWQRSNHHPGFEVFMEKRHKAYFVKDVTKSLLIKPINPFTGRPIYESYFSNLK